MQKLGIFCVCVMVGWVLKHKTIFGERLFRYVSLLVFYVTLPCAIISSFSNFRLQWNDIWIAAMGFLAGMVLIFLGFLSGRGKQQKALFMICFQGFNIGCFALPYLQTMMSERAVVVACLFDMGNSFLVCGGAFILAGTVLGRNEEAKSGRGDMAGIGEVFKKMLSSVPLMIQFAMCILSLLAVRLPEPVFFLTKQVGSCNGYLSMLMVGLGMELMVSREEQRTLWKILAIRYSFAAVLAGIVMLLENNSSDLKQILVILLFSPVSISNTLFVNKLFGEKGREVKIACEVSSISIIISVVIMTIVLLVL